MFKYEATGSTLKNSSISKPTHSKRLSNATDFYHTTTWKQHRPNDSKYQAKLSNFNTSLYIFSFYAIHTPQNPAPVCLKAKRRNNTHPRARKVTIRIYRNGLHLSGIRQNPTQMYPIDTKDPTILPEVLVVSQPRAFLGTNCLGSSVAARCSCPVLGHLVGGSFYLGQPEESSSRPIWHRTQRGQKVDSTQSLHIEPWIPSMSRTLTRIGVIPAAQIVQQDSPRRLLSNEP